MNSRDKIIEAVKKAKPEFKSLPEININSQESVYESAFCAVLESIGGRTVIIKDKDSCGDAIKALFPTAINIASNVIKSTLTINDTTDKEVLNLVDVAVLAGTLGVAENGAVWLSEDCMLHRALPYITQHLVLVLDKTKLVPNMHVAYQQVKPKDYGVFIAGPSKTADIEQSLVIGAHGARSLTVLLY